MTYTEQAIKKAIEGGYTFHKIEGTQWFKKTGMKSYKNVHITEVFLDPLFWQCLGKSMGWNADNSHRCSLNHIERLGKSIACTFCEGQGKDGIYWLTQWHTLIDHLASGGDVEGYLKSLLK